MRPLRPTALATALAAALTTGLLGAPTARADMGQCPPSHFCLWEHLDYTGRLYSSPASVSYIGAEMNDHPSAYWNRTRWWVTPFYDADYQGGCVMKSLGPGASFPRLPEDMNDVISSFLVTSSRIC
ncbi:peptidase inhibitor family I36 protein [Streptomyces clavuligerus]|nr:peptidase inhibitor family I36 protein [Streptomyces clavuligerus]ANW22491.1 hypothetical protein BB341_29720 [Streptomyces clavuligerus]MBY6306941.1 peptidase inhibitor family I36 protein [Streptomyces clavuligerus]QPL67008.1 peptidase inhibitor family I36 protein [Streptomyces clavuligerus]QPL73038.1 peptidase inhibitor family I36 protein [Streptomyces clavuligerus]QPL79111.1 peptidase inhibitor family I36 protein [Streptomyces clavuligerus]